jgi:hypothetical protein
VEVEKGRERKGSKERRRWRPVGKINNRKGHARIRRQRRRRRNSFPQGPMRKYRKLQGPICKIKFPVDLKPK